MLYICFNIFEEIEILERHIEAVRKAAPEGQIVVVDGAYQAYPHACEECYARDDKVVTCEHRGPDSADGTLELIDRIADHVIRCNGTPWPSEEVKRTQYFIGKEGDEYLVIDADEEIVGTFPMAVSLQDANCLLCRDDGSPGYPVFRYHKHSDGMKYHGHHNALWRNDKHIKPKRLPVLKGFNLIHKRSLRDEERQHKKGIYYSWLADHERAFRSIIRS